MDDENSLEFQALLKHIERSTNNNTEGSTSYRQNDVVDDDQGWQTVSKRKKKSTSKHPEKTYFHDDVIRSIKQLPVDPPVDVNKSRKDKQTEKTYDDVVIRGQDDREEEEEEEVEKVIGDVKKSKKTKKVKKVKVSVGEAALKINDSDLAVFLADISEAYESQPDTRLGRFAEYFGKAFGDTASSQFPWVKVLKEASVEKMIDIPLACVSEDVYRTSADWINLQPVVALGKFVMWCMDSIVTDLALRQGPVKGGSKKAVQQPTSKSQVAIFLVLAIVLRRKPDVLIGLLPTIKDSKYQGMDKLPFLLWTITQACQGDLVVGLFMWVRLLLPIVCSKSGCIPQSRDLILQLVERIASSTKARTVLVNGAARKGERVVPPSALELLMESTFPAPASRVKATERFEAVYPLLKEVALTVAPGSKAIKQLTQKLLLVAAKAARKGNTALADEASNIFLWCLSQSSDCYKQWDDMYVDNLEASVVVLKKLPDELKMHSAEHSSLDPLRAALKSFRHKNQSLLDSSDDTRSALLKDADKHCNTILSKFSRGNGCFKATAFLTVTMAFGVALIIKDPQLVNLKEVVDLYLSRAFTSLSLKLYMTTGA